MRTPTKTKPPVDGAVRVYPLVPTSAANPYLWAAARYRTRGWDPIPDDFEPFENGPAGDMWQMYVMWAIPPQAAGNGQAS